MAFGTAGEPVTVGTAGGPLKRARHLPDTHEQLPPQSSVPAAHSSVHATAEQSGHADRAAHFVGWQHSDGPQSASVLHSSETGAGSGDHVMLLSLA